MPSPNFSPSSPNYSVVRGSPDYSVGRGSPGMIPSLIGGFRKDSQSFRPVRVSGQLAAQSIRDEIFWSLYGSLGRQFGNFILSPEALEDGDLNTFSKLMNRLVY